MILKCPLFVNVHTIENVNPGPKSCQRSLRTTPYLTYVVQERKPTFHKTAIRSIAFCVPAIIAYLLRKIENALRVSATCTLITFK